MEWPRRWVDAWLDCPKCGSTFVRVGSAIFGNRSASWCQTIGIASITDIQPLHVATWIEQQTKIVSPPSVKQYLAALRHLFDWLVTGQIIPFNPAASVRGPKHTVKRGKTSVLKAEEAGHLLENIDTSTITGLRDRALIALMAYSFARVGAITKMKVEDMYTQNRRLWVRLHEKGGKEHTMPCHHNLESYLIEYLEKSGLAGEGRAPLFPAMDRTTKKLSRTALSQPRCHAMICRRTKAAGIQTKDSNAYAL